MSQKEKDKHQGQGHVQKDQHEEKRFTNRLIVGKNASRRLGKERQASQKSAPLNGQFLRLLIPNHDQAQNTDEHHQSD